MSDVERVELWERARGLHEVDRALVLWSALDPTPLAELADRPIGARDAGLLALRERLYGRLAPCHVACPACQESLEFVVDLAQLRQAVPAQAEFPLEVGEWRLTCRLPSSVDLRALQTTSDVAQAQDLLLARCVLVAERAGDRVAASRLPAEVRAAVDVALAARDPQAELAFEVACEACGHRWSSVFDVASYLWRELDVDVRRLFTQVDALARAYGWSETAILSLSRTRRQHYLQLVTR